MKRMSHYWLLGLSAGTLLAVSCPASGAELSITNFGYPRSTLNGARSIGTRPLVVILAAFGTTQLAHPKSYYGGSVFTNLPYNVNGFFRENPNGRFQFSRVNVIGPLAFSNS